MESELEGLPALFVLVAAPLLAAPLAPLTPHVRRAVYIKKVPPEDFTRHGSGLVALRRLYNPQWLNDYIEYMRRWKCRKATAVTVQQRMPLTHGPHVLMHDLHNLKTFMYGWWPMQFPGLIDDAALHTWATTLAAHKSGMQKRIAARHRDLTPPFDEVLDRGSALRRDQLHAVKRAAHGIVVDASEMLGYDDGTGACAHNFWGMTDAQIKEVSQAATVFLLVGTYGVGVRPQVIGNLNVACFVDLMIPTGTNVARDPLKEKVRRGAADAEGYFIAPEVRADTRDVVQRCVAMFHGVSFKDAVRIDSSSPFNFWFKRMKAEANRISAISAAAGLVQSSIMLDGRFNGAVRLNAENVHDQFVAATVPGTLYLRDVVPRPPAHFYMTPLLLKRALVTLAVLEYTKGLGPFAKHSPRDFTFWLNSQLNSGQSTADGATAIGRYSYIGLSQQVPDRAAPTLSQRTGVEAQTRAAVAGATTVRGGAPDLDAAVTDRAISDAGRRRVHFASRSRAFAALLHGEESRHADVARAVAGFRLTMAYSSLLHANDATAMDLERQLAASEPADGPHPLLVDACEDGGADSSLVWLRMACVAAGVTVVLLAGEQLTVVGGEDEAAPVAHMWPAGDVALFDGGHLGLCRASEWAPPARPVRQRAAPPHAPAAAGRFVDQCAWARQYLTDPASGVAEAISVQPPLQLPGRSSAARQHGRAYIFLVGMRHQPAGPIGDLGDPTDLSDLQVRIWHRGTGSNGGWRCSFHGTALGRCSDCTAAGACLQHERVPALTCFRCSTPDLGAAARLAVELNGHTIESDTPSLDGDVAAARASRLHGASSDGDQQFIADVLDSSAEQDTNVLGLLTRRDLCTLGPGGHLNDMIVNRYLQLVTGWALKHRRRHVLCLSTHCYSLYAEHGLDDRVARLIGPAVCSGGVFQHDLVLVPINEPGHWILAAVNLVDNTFALYDSVERTDADMEQRSANYCRQMVSFLKVAPRPAPPARLLAQRHTFRRMRRLSTRRGRAATGASVGGAVSLATRPRRRPWPARRGALDQTPSSGQHRPMWSMADGARATQSRATPSTVASFCCRPPSCWHRAPLLYRFTSPKTTCPSFGSRCCSSCAVVPCFPARLPTHSRFQFHLQAQCSW